jgi:hypothetical protein
MSQHSPFDGEDTGTFAGWKSHVDARLTAQDRKLDEILATFRASKFGASAIAWLAAVGAAIAVMWSNLHGGK